MRLAPKAMVVFSLLATAPVVAGAWLIVPRYAQAVTDEEKAYQSVVAKEVNGLVDARVSRVYDDARAVAAAVSFAAKHDDSSTEAAIKAVLSTRETVDVARLEIPSRKVSTVISKAENDASLAPASTEETRAEADEKGISFRPAGDKTGAMVVPVVPAPGTPSTAPKAYITVPVHLQPLEEDLGTLVASRSFEDADVVITDSTRHVVVARGSWKLASGADAAHLPFFKVVPETPPPDVGVQFDYDDTTGKMVGSVVTVRSLGWIVGIARPHQIAYAKLHELQRALAIIGGAVVLLSLVTAAFAARAVVKPLLALRDKAARIGRRAWREVSSAQGGNDELAELDRGMTKMAVDLETQEAELDREVRRRADLSRFLSKEVVERVMSGAHSLELGGQRREVSVLFADVVAFTTFAETQPAERTVALLNELFSVLTEVVFRHGGVVDKFVGDSIMAVWGAPIEQPDHAERALETAEDMLRFLESATEDWKIRFDVEVRLGIGVNSGEAIVGNVGSEKRMEYTVIGDVVNIAARLESIAKPNQILVGEATRDLAMRSEKGTKQFPLVKLGAEKLTGRTSEITVYELGV